MAPAPKLFKPIDLIAPIGVCLISVALCIWGAVVALDIAAKCVSIATGVVFAAGPVVWYWMRRDYIRHDFQTIHGLFVRCGKENRPSKEHVEKWTDELLRFWPTTELAKVYPLSGPDVARAVDGVWAIFYDEEKLLVRRPGGAMGFVYGYARPTEIGIRRAPTIAGRPIDEAATRALFRHELSHVVVEKQVRITGEAEHHKIFQDVKLGG